MSNYDFTEKAEATFNAAIQLAKDYANSQVSPVHFAHVMLNEDTLPAPPGAMPNAGNRGGSIFTQAIQKAGGDPVCGAFRSLLFLYVLTYFVFIGPSQSRRTEAASSTSGSRSSSG
jgi:hypothetical protein